MNVTAKFEVRSFTRSWENRDSQKISGSPWLRPRPTLHILKKIYKPFSAMAKTISGHSTPKSAMAMAIVAIPVAPPLDVLTYFSSRTVSRRGLYTALTLTLIFTPAPSDCTDARQLV